MAYSPFLPPPIKDPQDPRAQPSTAPAPAPPVIPSPMGPPMGGAPMGGPQGQSSLTDQDLLALMQAELEAQRSGVPSPRGREMQLQMLLGKR